MTALDDKGQGGARAHYRAEVKNISRASGRSAVAAAAYRSAERLRDHRQDMTHEYQRTAEHLENSEIITPDDAPEWMKDREALWNAAEAAENRKDARTAKEILLSLPRELDPGQRAELVREFVRDQVGTRNLVADVAIHNPAARDRQEQPHAHILTTTRPVEGEGFAPRKHKGLDRPEGIRDLREKWGEHANRALARAGLEQRVDHRSLEAQRAEAQAQGDEARAWELDRAPEPKMGHVGQRIEREGRHSHAVADALEARQERQERQGLAQQFRQAAQAVKEVGQQIEQARDRLVSAAREFLDQSNVKEAGQALHWREAGRVLKDREKAREQEQGKAHEKPEPGTGQFGHGKGGAQTGKAKQQKPQQGRGMSPGMG